MVSGHVTVTTAGTAVQGPDIPGNIFCFTAHPSNTNPVWLGNVAGDIANSNGFPLKPQQNLYLRVNNLNALWFDATTNGEKVCYIRVL